MRRRRKFFKKNCPIKAKISPAKGFLLRFFEFSSNNLARGKNLAARLKTWHMASIPTFLISEMFSSFANTSSAGFTRVLWRSLLRKHLKRTSNTKSFRAGQELLCFSSQVQCLAVPSTSTCLLPQRRNFKLCTYLSYAKRKYEPVRLKKQRLLPKDLKPLTAWEGISIEELAGKMKKDVDHVFECILRTELLRFVQLAASNCGKSIRAPTFSVGWPPPLPVVGGGVRWGLENLGGHKRLCDSSVSKKACARLSLDWRLLHCGLMIQTCTGA